MAVKEKISMFCHVEPEQVGKVFNSHSCSNVCNHFLGVLFLVHVTEYVRHWRQVAGDKQQLIEIIKK